jgi:uncharacterized protein YdhG (YjbR/CyaY superfamily)
MEIKAANIEEYLNALPEDRRAAVEAVRKVIRKNIDKKFEEGMQYGMPAWYVPHRIYPAGYHCDPTQPVPFVSVASQKSHVAIYMFCIYAAPGEAERFERAWKATGKKLDMGKGCVRFKKLEDVPLEVVGDAIKRATMKQFLEHYESAIKSSSKRRSSAGSSKKTSKKSTRKSAAGKALKKASKAPAKKTKKK